MMTVALKYGIVKQYLQIWKTHLDNEVGRITLVLGK